ncbi:MAG: T9SS type A sorting domain-containing protein [Flavobacteriales bacterium]
MKKIYLVGSLLVMTVCSTVALMKSNAILPGKYQAKKLNARDLNSAMATKGADEALEWMKARYIDVTTGMPVSEEKLQEIRKKVNQLGRSKNIAFTEEGPDNIGGRTRAIQIDRTNVNRVWAGGVSGGLFVSNNKGNTWSRVNEYFAAGANPYIYSMTQTPDGVLYVATGSNQEGWGGNGVWYTADFGATWNTIPNTNSCTQVVSSNADNFVWLATTGGLKKWKNGDASLTAVPVTTGSCTALEISKDGQLVLCAFGANKTYVSTDGGANFSDRSGTATNNLVPTSAPRIEFAISPIKNSSNHYSLYAVRTNSNLLSMHVSHDDGATWTQFVGASGPPSEFDIYRDQGTYNSIVSVVPTDPEQILIGGIDIWRWKQTVNNPPSGGFQKISLWSVAPQASIYVHADNHEMKWDQNNRFYAGNDGGVSISNDNGNTWFVANRGYNVTQFYGIAFDRDGAVMGGTQDNGTLYNNHTLSTYQEFRQVGGGDGFECEISYFNPAVMFSTIYYNNISRSGDKGNTWSTFEPLLPSSYDPPGTDGSAFHPFHTEVFLSEYYDLNSKDSVTYIPTKNYAAGSTIRVPSLSSGDSIVYTSPNALYFDDTLIFNPALTANGINYGQNAVTGELVEMGTDTMIFNVSWDTLRVADPFQSWFLVYVNANGGELWGTRNALRLSVQNPQWVCVARGIGGGLFNSVDVEFSKDLEHCFISAGNGVWRVDGLGSVYTSDEIFVSTVGYVGTGAQATTPTYTTATKITTTNYEGIAVNPSDADDIVLFAGFNGTNRRSLNATSATPTYTALPSIIAGSQPACYDGIIDRDDPNIIVVGTSEGVFVTENGGGLWENASSGFEGTPVFEVRQSWRTFEEGNNRPGEIYIGTFGRGIWKTGAYLGVGDNGAVNSGSSIKDMITYPNPSSTNTTLSFELEKEGDVMVSVYSISGALVKKITKEKLMAGKQELTIDSETLNEGIYIIKMQSGQQSQSVTFVKM